MRSEKAYWFSLFPGLRSLLWVYRLALQRVYLIVIGILVIGSAGYIWSSREVATYQASASVIVLDQLHPSSGEPVNGISYAARLAKQAASPLNPTMIFQVQERVPQRGAAQIRQEVHLAAVPGQPLIAVTALDADASIAIALANSSASVLALDNTIVSRQPAAQKVADLQSQVDMLSAEVGNTINAIDVASNDGQPVADLQAQLQSLQMQLDQLQIQLAQAQRDAASVQPTFWVASVALSASKNAPNLLINTALGAFAGALAGLGLAELLDLLNGVVRGPEDFLRWGRVSPLGEVPDAPTDETPFVFTGETAAAVAQPFRRVWKHLQFLGGETAGQASLALPVGSAPSDGWVGLNLALTSAQSGQQTLLLDANWMRPTVEGYFQLPVSEQGFFTSLAAMTPSSFESWPAIKPTGIPHLFVLPVGSLSLDHESLVHPNVLADFFALLRRDFAQIIVLPPPDVLHLAGGAFLKQMDTVLLIARSKHATVAEIKSVLADMGKIGGPFLGAVLLVSKPDLFNSLPLDEGTEGTEEADEPAHLSTYQEIDSGADQADG